MRAQRAQVLRRGCSAITNVRLPKASGLLHLTSRGLFRTIAIFLIICSLPTHFKSQPTTERQLCGTAGKWLMLTAPMRSTAGRHYNQVSRAYWQIHSLYFRIFRTPEYSLLTLSPNPDDSLRGKGTAYEWTVKTWTRQSSDSAAERAPTALCESEISKPSVFITSLDDDSGYAWAKAKASFMSLGNTVRLCGARTHAAC